MPDTITDSSIKIHGELKYPFKLKQTYNYIFPHIHPIID